MRRIPTLMIDHIQTLEESQTTCPTEYFSCHSRIGQMVHTAPAMYKLAYCRTSAISIFQDCFLIKFQSFKIVLYICIDVKASIMELNPDVLYRNSHRLVSQVSLDFKREVYDRINWKPRIIVSIR